MNKMLSILYFQLKIYQKAGNEFQTFFSKIMGYIDSDFTSIKPHGNWGDGGNDGCNLKVKHYYQIHSPSATTALNAGNQLKKAITDYKKLQAKWGTVEGYSFVINDKFTGTPAPLALDFTNFIDSQGIKTGEIIDSLKLQRMFSRLGDDDKLDVLDMFCLETADSDFAPDAIGELIKHLINDSAEYELSLLTIDAPDFGEKIKFNKLSPYTASKLTASSFEIYKVDEFIRLQGDDGISQELSRKIHDIYIDLLNTIPENTEHRNELIYIGLKDAIVPDYAKKNKISRMGFDKVAEIIISKYFEACDIYENPNVSIAT